MPMMEMIMIMTAMKMMTMLVKITTRRILYINEEVVMLMAGIMTITIVMIISMVMVMIIDACNAADDEGEYYDRDDAGDDEGEYYAYADYVSTML